jgi:hypothetical protein
MSVSAGTYTIGTGGGYDYTSVRAFALDIAATLTGNLTGIVSTPITETQMSAFNAKALANYTLTLTNSITNAYGDPNLATNTITFDSTAAPFHGLFFRQDSANTTGAFTVCNQHFKRKNATRPTGTQSADVYFAATTYSYVGNLYNNIFNSPDGADGSSWYCLWMAGAAACTYNVYQNLMYGYNYGIIAQQTSVGAALIENNTFHGYSGYGIGYQGTGSVVRNNYALAPLVANRGYHFSGDCTGYSNAAAQGTSATTYKVGTGYNNVGTPVSTTTWANQAFDKPVLGSTLMHKGVAPGVATNTRYIDGLPILTNDITIGCMSRPNIPMVTQII